ncbi:hypothetical protein [Pseudarthrobacter sulfonivorans]|uniref:type II secretion system F family protein n=1 Tax=Pseudarthrobacter sulfonivorans TaxID=121292 RepID=UPI002866B815|nr:hypothetical protein [Pseudarthrobacter sulfonivorans]MDR6415076.1 tight adherence protein B [Pseudarthrobacter sulfonivorans]
MMAVLAGILAAAAILLFRPPGGAVGRFRRAGGSTGPRRAAAGRAIPGDASVERPARHISLGVSWSKVHRAGPERGQLSLTLVVQQLAALLKGGRTPARLWDELWLVHCGRPEAGPRRQEDIAGQVNPAKAAGAGRNGPSLSPGSLMMLGAVRAAASRGLPVSEAIRRAAAAAFPRSVGREQRIWLELAACFDIAEASGCPLADVLARFAAQLEVEDDADAARQTALAGPKATVSLLTWLPVMGLGLGMALGVDPLAILFGTPLGMAALAAGVALTIAGRIWSARLVHTAAGAAP